MIRLNEEWKFAPDLVDATLLAAIGRKAWISSGVQGAKWDGYICVLEKEPGHLLTYFYKNYPKARRFHGTYPTNLF